MITARSIAIRDAHRDIADAQQQIPYEADAGLTGALIVAAAIDRNTDAINKNTEALRDLRGHRGNTGPG